MNRKVLVPILAAALTAGAFPFVLARTLAAPPAGSPVPRTITYEGNLDQNGKPAPDGTFDFAFTFWNDVAAGTQVGTKISKTGIQVTGGKFIVEIGPIDDDAVFETIPLYVELSVDNNKLAPRQKMNAAVFAVRAEKAEVANTATKADGVVGFESWTASQMVDMARVLAGAAACNSHVYGKYAVSMAYGQSAQDACSAKGFQCAGFCVVEYTDTTRSAVECIPPSSCNTVAANGTYFACCK